MATCQQFWKNVYSGQSLKTENSGDYLDMFSSFMLSLPYQPPSADLVAFAREISSGQNSGSASRASQCVSGGGKSTINTAVILMESNIHLRKSLQSLLVVRAKGNVMKFSLAVLKRTLTYIKFDSLFYFVVNNAILEGA